jgi:hypothetical protein
MFLLNAMIANVLDFMPRPVVESILQLDFSRHTLMSTPWFPPSSGLLNDRAMKRLILIFSVVAAAALARAEEPPAHIDLGKFPAKTVEDVIVPVPSEIFGVLDKLQSPNWHEIMRPVKSSPSGQRPQIALLLGNVIAEGFIAVEAKDGEEVKKIGKAVKNLAKAINVEKSVTARSNSIIEAADKKDWQKVRLELDGALRDVRAAMTEMQDDQLAQLVSLGGWLRGTEALTTVVAKNYSKDGAELLHQPRLLEHFQQRLSEMDGRLKNHALVARIHKRLPEIRPLIADPNGDIPKKSVEQIRSITGDLIQAITSKES